MDFDKLHDLYVDKRLPSNQVAYLMGVHISTIERNLRKKGWVRGPSERKLSPLAFDVLKSYEKLSDLYVNRGLTAKEIAAHLDVGQATVRRALDALEIQRRPSAEARTSQDAYDSLRDAPTLIAMYERLGLVGAAAELGVNRQTVANHLTGYGVELSKGSSGENALALALTLEEQPEWMPDNKVHRNTRKIIPPLELDMYFPDEKLAVEFNGIYWHTEEMVGKDYHRKKYELCAEKGIQLIQVWEDEWNDRQPVVLSMIRHKLGTSMDPKCSARDCEVVEAPLKEAHKFHETHHIQGGTSSSVDLGLQLDDRLVALCSFKATGADGEWDLTRFSTSMIVRGGFSKLLKAFCRTREWKSIKTFADLCVSDGGLYEQNGFVAVSTLAPDYKYVVGDRRIHKFNYRKERFESDPELIFDPSMTEAELAELNGLSRIWDAGKIKYILTNNQEDVVADSDHIDTLS